MSLSDYFDKKLQIFHSQISEKLENGDITKGNIIPFRSSKPMATREEAKKAHDGEYDVYNIVEKGIKDLFS